MSSSDVKVDDFNNNLEGDTIADSHSLPSAYWSGTLTRTLFVVHLTVLLLALLAGVDLTSFLHPPTKMGNQAAAAAAHAVTTPPEQLMHYVLKKPLAPPLVEPIRKLIVATGCYWGSEKSFWRMPGVVSTAVGNCGGTVENPSYEYVCTGQTGHAESVIVFYDSTKVSFTDLIRQFLQSHDPTQGDGQGNDRGTQYRSALFLDNEVEVKVAKAAIQQYEKQIGKKITTEVRCPAPPFYYAEDYMQQYLAKPGSRPYCSAMPTGIQLAPYEEWAPKDVPEEYAPKLGEDYWSKYGPVKGCVIRDPHEQIKWPQKL